MKENMKNVLVVTLIVGLCLPIVGIATAVQPTYGNIALDPEEPTRQTEVTFTVDVTGADIEEVFIKVQECVDPGTSNYFCHAGLLNLSLTNAEGTSTWEGTGTLQYDDSDVGHCWLVVKSNGIWYDDSSDSAKYTNFTIVPEDNGSDNNGADGGDNTGKTPGFELLLVIVSIVVALFIYKKKRT
jgi:hypothetical protein